MYIYIYVYIYIYIKYIYLYIYISMTRYINLVIFRFLKIFHVLTMKGKNRSVEKDKKDSKEQTQKKYKNAINRSEKIPYVQVKQKNAKSWNI